MSSSEIKIIEERMYEIVSPIIEEKISKCVIRLLRRGLINNKNIYSISFFRPQELQEYLYEAVYDINNRYKFKKDRLEIFSDVMTKIINNNKYKLKAVCKYGYNNHLCFDFLRRTVYDYTSLIAIFFKFRK
jgi:hypothetical protein